MGGGRRRLARRGIAAYSYRRARCGTPPAPAEENRRCMKLVTYPSEDNKTGVGLLAAGGQHRGPGTGLRVGRAVRGAGAAARSPRA